MGSLQFYLDAIGGSAQIYDIYAVPKNFYTYPVLEYLNNVQYGG
jgi:hypothetical protein